MCLVFIGRVEVYIVVYVSQEYTNEGVDFAGF